MEPLVWKSSEMGLWMDQVITASSNTTFSLSFAAGMEVAWTGCGGNKTAPQSMSQMWTCVIWTHSLAQGWSAEDPSAELTGLPAHLICRHWTSVCGAISRARSHYVHAHSKSCYSNNHYRGLQPLATKPGCPGGQPSTRGGCPGPSHDQKGHPWHEG